VTEYMLMFSLGPVQIFIEQARKTRDLWLGSFLLALLMEAAMKEVERTAAKFVFPTERRIAKRNANLPNKYIAIFQTFEEARRAVDLSKEGIRERWEMVREDVWNAIVARYATSETSAIWNEQSNPDMLFEIFWVIVEGNPELYSDWLQRTAAALDARKRLRNFQPKVELGEKSTISGERQALHGPFDDSDSIRNQVRKFWKDLASRAGSTERPLSVMDISRDGSERLDAIDTIKRFATWSSLLQGLKHAFPSTSSVATASFVERLLAVDAAQLQKWRNATRGPLASMPTDAIPYLAQRAGRNEWILQRDGDCYFHETFHRRRLEKDYAISSVDEADRVALEGRRGLDELFEATDKETIRRPTPYYAIMKMDGDRMGRLLSGVHNRSEHINISAALSDFARNLAPSLVQEHYPGLLVYAGGDDLLALAPLARDIPAEQRDNETDPPTLLVLVDGLQRQYRERVQREISDLRQAQVTVSIGIAIAHHLTPLSAALRAAREAEHLAKERYDRNALVVTVMRRSGEQTRVGCHWEYSALAQEAQPIALFSRFYTLFDRDVLSPKCVYSLLEEAPILLGLTREAQASEIKRMLLRQRDSKQQDILTDSEAVQLARNVVDLAAAMDREHADWYRATELHVDELRYGLIETLGWLLVTVFLARREQD
jgi:CRISPR-associated protein Cmr2